MVTRRHQAGGTGRGRRAEGDVHPPWLARRVQVVEHPDLARALVHHAAAVRAGLAGVTAVVVGVPQQARPIQLRRVEVARPLVVGQERQPAPDQHRARELPGHAGQDAPERARGPGGPQAPRRPAPVPLPERRIPSPAAVQQGAGPGLQSNVRHRAELEPTRRPGAGGHGVRPGEPVEGLARTGEREDLAVRCPSADPGVRVTPVGEPAAGLAVHLGQVDLGRPVAPARPGHQGSVRAQPRMTDRSPVGGKPPGPAPGGGGEPDVILGHEGQQVTADVRKSKVPG